MKKSFKKTLAFVLAFALCVGLCAVGGGAEGETVAKIGETTYDSLVTAFGAASDGDTITMIDDEMIDVVGYAITIPAGKNITLDLNGKTVTGNCTSGATSAVICNKGTLTINDSSSDQSGKLISNADPAWRYSEADPGGYASNLISNEGTLTVNSGTLYNGGDGSACYAIDNYSAGKVTINGGRVDAKKSSAIRMFYNNGGEVNVTGGVIGHYNSDDDCSYMGIQVQDGTNAKVNISGGTIDGEYAFYSTGKGNSSVSISGGDFPGYVMFGSTASNNVAISGGTIYYVLAYGSQTKFVSGGIYEYAPASTYIAEGYEVLPTANGRYIVIPEGAAVAKIGETKYATLSDAAAAATDGDTIVMLNDAVLAESYTELPAAGKSVTLDLAGKKITGGALDVYGTLTIVDSGTDGSITGAKHGIWVNEGAALNIESGTITNNGEGYPIIANPGTVSISGGTVRNSVGSGAVYVKNGSLTITDGTIVSTKDGTDAVCITGNTTATVSGGEITGYDWGISAWDTAFLTVTGGTIKTSDEEGYGITTNGNAGQNATIAISGGTITGTDLGIYAPSGDWTISGGTITGATGVYFKSQNLSISGGTVNGTGAKVDYDFNGNGGNPTGDALVIDSCNYPNGIDGVSVTGGTFISTNAKAVGSYTAQGGSAVTNFISGGKFSDEPALDEIVLGKMAQKGDDGMWTIVDANFTFTVTLEPQGDAAKGESDSIVDAEVGGTVYVDVKLKNTSDSAVRFSSAQLLLDLDSNLTATSIALNESIGGTISLEGNTSKAINYFAPETEGSTSYTLEGGEEITLGTLTLSVKASPVNTKKYGDIMSISIENPSNWTCILVTGLTDEVEPTVIGGQVELVTKYEITYVDSIDGTTTTEEVGYNIKPTPETPVKPGFTFDGWQATDGTVYATTADLPVAVATETYTALWTFDGNVVFIDYAYAGNGNMLMLVGLKNDPADGEALCYGQNKDALFWTDTSYYTDLLKTTSGETTTTYNKAYLYIVPSSTTVADAYKALSFATGENIKVGHDDYDINGNRKINAGDYGIVDDLLAGRNSAANMEMRLKADTNTSEYNEITKFGSIADIRDIIVAANNF